MVERKTQQPEAGLTLIEVTFAVLILAGSLVILLGLQTSSLRLAANDKSTQRAMLMTRRLLAPIETTNQQLENASYEGDLASVLSQVSPHDKDLEPNAADKLYTIKMQISDWGIPTLNEKAMKQVQLSVAWGSADEERLETYYFLPYEEGREDEDVP